MCYPKPRARCASSIDKQYKSLYAQKQKIKARINDLSIGLITHSDELNQFENFLTQINVEIEKNRIDWAASKEGQETFDSISQNRKITFDEALQQYVGNQRKIFQDTAYKKLLQTEESYENSSEGFWACKHTGSLIVNNIKYEIAGLQAREEGHRDRLRNLNLPQQSRDEAIKGLKEVHKKILLNELNLSDMETFLKENEQKYLHSFAQAS